MVHLQLQCRNLKKKSVLLLTVTLDQTMFFSETCFAFTISESEFRVGLYAQYVLVHWE